MGWLIFRRVVTQPLFPGANGLRFQGDACLLWCQELDRLREWGHEPIFAGLGWGLEWSPRRVSKGWLSNKKWSPEPVRENGVWAHRPPLCDMKWASECGIFSRPPPGSGPKQLHWPCAWMPEVGRLPRGLSMQFPILPPSSPGSHGCSPGARFADTHPPSPESSLSSLPFIVLWVVSQALTHLCKFSALNPLFKIIRYVFIFQVEPWKG